MEKKGCCGQIDFDNFGTCRFCFSLAIIVNLFFWTGYYVIKTYMNLPNWASFIIFCFNLLLALLLIMHIIAFFSKKNK